MAVMSRLWNVMAVLPYATHAGSYQQRLLLLLLLLALHRLLLLALQVYISVNEEGTEAAAMTVIGEQDSDSIHGKPPPKIV
jgi:hypothetical protein